MRQPLSYAWRFYRIRQRESFGLAAVTYIPCFIHNIYIKQGYTDVNEGGSNMLSSIFSTSETAMNSMDILDFLMAAGVSMFAGLCVAGMYMYKNHQSHLIIRKQYK